MSGPLERVEVFLKYARSGDGEALDHFDFRRFIPYPCEFEILDKVHEEFFGGKPPGERTVEEWLAAPRDGYNSGGNQWCIEHWGTNSNARRARVERRHEFEGELEVLVMFETAWSPPLPVVKRASERFPDLEFELRYFECLGGFNGCCRCQAGEVICDISGAYFGERGG